MIRLVLNPRDDVAFRRIVNVPPRGLGATTLNKVERIAARDQVSVLDGMRRLVSDGTLAARATKAVQAFLTMLDGWCVALAQGVAETDLSAFVASIIAESGLERHFKSGGEEEQERLENLEELISAAADREADIMKALELDEAPPLRQRLASWLESIALVSDADAVDPEQGAVTLMTLHAAKGLEFDVVAIAALEQGVLPHSRSAEDPAQLEEERRLCYVGMTRARDHLMLTRARMRTFRGIRERTTGSAFLEEIPADTVRHIESEPPWGSSVDDAPVFRTSPNVTGVAPGVRVRHPRFGVGKVRRVLQRPQGTTATIDFDDWGPRTLYVSRTSLEVLDSDDTF
jgi:DNA helicase-2/ATP-dependent DNA helicase PcrA